MAKRRGNGEGTVSKVKTGWKAVVTLGYREDGRRITRSRTERSKADAYAWLAQFKAERNAAQGKPDLPAGLLFCEWIETFLKDCERDQSTNTYERYRDVLYRFVIPTLGRIPLADLKPMAFRNLFAEVETQGVINQKKDGEGNTLPSERTYAGTRTLDSVYEVSKTCLMAAVKLDLIPSNPVSKVSRPKYQRADIFPFELSEIASILNASESHRLHSLFVTAFSLGLRQGELFGLEWRDVDFTAGTLRIERQAIAPRGGLQIKDPKTKAGRRTLDLTKAPEVIDVLQDRRKRAVKEELASCPLVFPGAHGAYLRGNTFAKRHWKPLLQRCKIEPRGLHHARHSFATHALLNGEALHVVSQILGHASPTVTLKTYSHLIGSSQAETLGRVAKLFSIASLLHPAESENHVSEAS
jgi:integrase